MAVDLSFSGLASGFDWKTFVNQIMAVQQAPITTIQTQEKKNTDQNSALTELQTDLTTLQQASQALAAPTLFTGRTVTSTTPNSTWKPVVATGTALGSYAVKVTQLATTAVRNGAAGRSKPLNPTDDVSGLTLATLAVTTPVTAGTFTVNGKPVTVALTDSLDQVFSKIATATSGAVTASYDHTADRITLSGGSEIVLGAANDTSDFLTALGLGNNGTATVTSSAKLGALNPATPVISARLNAAITAVDGTGNGSFAINGVNISYNVNTDTLATIFDRINQSTAGVTAAYDATADRVTLANNVTGDSGIAVSEATGGLMDALGLTGGSALAHGTNAQFTVNGGATRSSTSNNLSALALGVPGLTLTVDTKDTQAISVGSDTASMSNAIGNFLSSYNTIQTFLDSNTTIANNGGTVTSGLLAGNREVQDWGTSLRSRIFRAVPGLSGTISRLNDLGIDFTPGTSQLAVKDTAKLNNALTSSAPDLAAFFQSNTTGIAYQINSFVGTLLTANTKQQAALTGSNKDLDAQIANIQRRLDQQKALLTASFVAMENAQSAMQSQLAALNNAFPSSSSSTTTGKLK